MEVATPRLSTPVKRKLTTILAADVESYTRLMRQNEEQTLRTLSEFREVIDRLIERHEGRIFSTAGDSVLAEFSSTVEAARCAISFQEEITARNAELPEGSRLRFRIGLNVGDVMAKGESLYGDAINVAARLEGLAESGGICISGTAFEQIKHKMSLGFEDMGAQSVKNIDEPISVYRLVGGPVSVNPPAAKPAPAVKETRKKDKRQRRIGLPGKKTLTFAIVLAVAFVWFDSSKMPSAMEACSGMKSATHKIWQHHGQSSMASRVKQQESWGFRFLKIWDRAQKELCY